MFEITDNYSAETLNFALELLAHIEQETALHTQLMVLQDGSGVSAIRRDKTAEILGDLRDTIHAELKNLGDF